MSRGEQTCLPHTLWSLVRCRPFSALWHAKRDSVPNPSKSYSQMVKVPRISMVCCPTKRSHRWVGVYKASSTGSFKSRIWRHLQRMQSALFWPVWWWHGGHSVLLLHRMKIRRSGVTGKEQPFPPLRTGEVSLQRCFSHRLHLSVPWGWNRRSSPERRVAGLQEDPRKTTHREVHSHWLPSVHANTLSPLIKQLHFQDLKMASVGESFTPFVSPLDTCCLFSGHQRSHRTERCWKWVLFLHSWNSF